MHWRLVLPVKEAQRAKTRLHAPPPLSRPDLARAIALDTLHAVCRALPPGDVLTITSDPVVGPATAALGARVVPDPGAGLNAAVSAGIAAARALDEQAGVAVLLGDLPALRPQDLLEALHECAAHPRALVPDHDGTGTVLLTARPGVTVEPSFGPGSAARHGEFATVLTPDLPRLRQDVDDLAALQAAVALGVGTHTTQILGAARDQRTAAN
ncbi:2-phospho-L-lactate guanylyltransferase [Ornithinimicrobium ciconiae]|uniref:Phosphoenolpyruvate guanylyltransferase n=1 Tax=Ornithinimicrobium ciconiae TaxID=2594265 RepID=A0A516GFW0_9MICO|nr:2-phospho-L-lactate guanylyltransferase [Ornithinimicrobium ciconiae]